jgi:hypothetical protein
MYCTYYMQPIAFISIWLFNYIINLYIWKSVHAIEK